MSNKYKKLKKAIETLNKSLGEIDESNGSEEIESGESDDERRRKLPKKWHGGISKDELKYLAERHNKETAMDKVKSIYAKSSFKKILTKDELETVKIGVQLYAEDQIKVGTNKWTCCCGLSKDFEFVPNKGLVLDHLCDIKNITDALEKNKKIKKPKEINFTELCFLIASTQWTKWICGDCEKIYRSVHKRDEIRKLYDISELPDLSKILFK